MDIADNRTLYSVYTQKAKLHPDDVFVSFLKEDGDAVEWTYRQFTNNVNATGVKLLSLGLNRGDLINLCIPNHILYLEVILAASALAMCVVPSNPASSADELEYILRHSGAKLSITCAQSHKTLTKIINEGRIEVILDEELQRSIELTSSDELKVVGLPEDVVELLYTSGTTSRPKGVMLTNRHLIYGAESFRAATGLRDSDHHFISLPLFHAAAQCHALWPSLVAGCRITIVSRFSGSRFFLQVANSKCTMAALFGAPIRILLSQPPGSADWPHRLRNVTFAQNLTPEQQNEWLRRFKAPLQQLWGMTETAGLPIMSPLVGERRLAAMGRPILGYEIKIIDESGGEVRTGECGQLIVKGTPGRSIMKGYYNDPEASGRAIREMPDGMWLFTGDSVRTDADGYIYFVDREKDLIKRGGENISSFEIESSIARLPQVSDVAVIGIPDEIKDESIVAFVVLKANESLSEDALREHCGRLLSHFKVPQRLVFVDSLPRTSVGKIQKNVLREHLAAIR